MYKIITVVLLLMIGFSKATTHKEVVDSVTELRKHIQETYDAGYYDGVADAKCVIYKQYKLKEAFTCPAKGYRRTLTDNGWMELGTK